MLTPPSPSLSSGSREEPTLRMTIFNVLGQGNIYVLDHYPEDWTGNRISRVMAKLVVNMPYRRLPSGLDREHMSRATHTMSIVRRRGGRRGKGGRGSGDLGWNEGWEARRRAGSIRQAPKRAGYASVRRGAGAQPSLAPTCLRKAGEKGRAKQKKGGPLEACSTRPRLGAAPLRTNVSERNVRAMHNKAMQKQCGGTEEKE